MGVFEGHEPEAIGGAVVRDTARERGIVGAATARLAPLIVENALRRWRHGRLTVHLPDGSVRVAGGAGAEPHSTLWIARGRFFTDVLLRGHVGAGESYTNGDWRTDDLARFIALVVRNEDALGGDSWVNALLTLPDLARHAWRRNTRIGARRNIRAHYDLGNDLFALFLDSTMTYSSAVFDDFGEPLERAQRRKYDALCRRAGLRPGARVLEIGCGWGGFAVHAAREYGCHVTALTISREQLAFAAGRVRAAGLSDRIDLRFCDYRDVDGRYDAVVSIEMLEAVGRAHWPAYFATIDRVLEPGGRAALQVISMPDHRFPRYARQCDWIQKYIFPGGLLPSIGELCRAMAAHSTLTLRGLDDLAPHYAETLRRWRLAFLDTLDDVRALGFDDRFVRMWEFYLASCEAYFETRMIGLLQVVIARSGE